MKEHTRKVKPGFRNGRGGGGATNRAEKEKGIPQENGPGPEDELGLNEGLITKNYNFNKQLFVKMNTLLQWPNPPITNMENRVFPIYAALCLGNR